VKNDVVDITNEITKSLAETPATAQQVKDAVDAWKLDDLEKRLDADVEEAQAILMKCASGDPSKIDLSGTNSGAPATWKCNAPLPNLASAVEIAQNVILLQPRAAQSLQTLQDFAEDAQHLGEDVDFGTFAEASNDVLVTVTATPVTKYQRFFSAAAKKAQGDALRSFTFTVRTYSPVILSLGPAMVVRFMDSPKFGVEKAGDAYRIVRTDDDTPVAYNLAAMLSVAVRAWSNPTFTPYAQIGVDPAKDNIGLYAGVAANFWSAFSVGAGYVYQQVNHLARGLEESQLLTAPEQLKTKPGFTSGGYITISVPIVKK
jgi:hypothetical protein